jgi:hypothetical protein
MQPAGCHSLLFSHSTRLACSRSFRQTRDSDLLKSLGPVQDSPVDRVHGNVERDNLPFVGFETRETGMSGRITFAAALAGFLVVCVACL